MISPTSFLHVSSRSMFVLRFGHPLHLCRADCSYATMKFLLHAAFNTRQAHCDIWKLENCCQVGFSSPSRVSRAGNHVCIIAAGGVHCNELLAARSVYRCNVRFKLRVRRDRHHHVYDELLAARSVYRCNVRFKLRVRRDRHHHVYDELLAARSVYRCNVRFKLRVRRDRHHHVYDELLADRSVYRCNAQAQRQTSSCVWSKPEKYLLKLVCQSPPFSSWRSSCGYRLGSL